MKIYSKFTREHPCRSTELQGNFIEVARQHGCSPVNLLHIFTTPFSKSMSEGLLLSLPDEKVKGHKGKDFGGFSKQVKASEFKEFFHQVNFSNVTNVFV